MTNETLIRAAALQHGLFTEDQIKAYEQAGRRLPLHTYAEWQRLGFQVKRGEHAALKLQLWKMGKQKPAPAEDEDSPETSESRSKFFRTTAFLFLSTQVERIQQCKVA